MFTWFRIFNRAEFDLLGLVSRTYTLNLQGIGIRDILVTKGVSHGIFYDDVFLSLELNDVNPFEMDGYAIYVDESDDVFLGVAVES